MGDRGGVSRFASARAGWMVSRLAHHWQSERLEPLEKLAVLVIERMTFDDFTARRERAAGGGRSGDTGGRSWALNTSPFSTLEQKKCKPLVISVA